jgi:hypothetical protein
MDNGNNDIAKIISDMAHAQAHAVRVGCQITEQRYGRSIRALRLAFEAAQLDPAVKMPSALTATILALFALHEQDTKNIYGNPVVQREEAQA